jgi:hypothetical protein
MGIVPRVRRDERSSSLLQSRPFGAVLLRRDQDLARSAASLPLAVAATCCLPGRLGTERVGPLDIATK